MTDASGTVVWSADYKPFGEATVTVSTITNNLRFSGQYYDAETGLHYNYMRDYNPVVGRYIETDPLNLGTIRLLFPTRTEPLETLFKVTPCSQNLFVYVVDNPVKLSDPDGLAAFGEILECHTYRFAPDSCCPSGGRLEMICDVFLCIGNSDPGQLQPRRRCQGLFVVPWGTRVLRGDCTRRAGPNA